MSSSHAEDPVQRQQWHTVEQAHLHVPSATTQRADGGRARLHGADGVDRHVRPTAGQLDHGGRRVVAGEKGVLGAEPASELQRGGRPVDGQRTPTEGGDTTITALRPMPPAP